MSFGLIGVGLQLVSGLASSGGSEKSEKKDENPIQKLLDPLGLLGGKKDKEENPIEKLLSMVGGLAGGGGGGLSLLG
ncbi:MAG: hypothetical protein AB1706_18890 [Pseudomonadota bacterium]